VEGAYLVASPQGEKTYRGAGFERVGERVATAAGERKGGELTRMGGLLRGLSDDLNVSVGKNI
jgi:hypothetical protein